MKDKIIDCIRQRIVIKIQYKGFIRVVEPFTLGYHRDTNNLVLSAFQIAGYSKSEKEPKWRLYDLSKITSINLTNQQASNYRDGYNPQDKRMKLIIITC